MISILLIIERCTTCSLVYHADCSVTVELTNQLLLIISLLVDLNLAYMEAEDLIITLKSFDREKGELILMIIS